MTWHLSAVTLLSVLLRLRERLVFPDDLESWPVGAQDTLLDPQCAVARVFDRAHRVGDEEDRAGVLADRADPPFGSVTELLVADVESLVDDEDLVLD